MLDLRPARDGNRREAPERLAEEQAAAKHSRAERVKVTAEVRDDTLGLRVRDNGVGGAQPEGSGLLGLADRVAALGGRLRLDSPADAGTLVEIEIPTRSRSTGGTRGR